MKKTGFIVVLFFCLIAFHVNGQLSTGVKTDVNLSDFFGLTQTSDIKIRKKAGGSAGLFCKYQWLENRVVEMDMMFRYRTSELKNKSTGETADYSYFGIELPLYSLVQVEIDNQTVFVGLGPFVSFGLQSHYRYGNCNINLYRKDPVNSKSPVRRWDFGVGFLIGYELKCRLQFNFNYQLGLRNIAGDVFENTGMISQLVSLGTGYRF